MTRTLREQIAAREARKVATYLNLHPSFIHARVDNRGGDEFLECGLRLLTALRQPAPS
jgi:hypothetical protein